MKKILAFLLMILVTPTFAGDIYSMDESVNEYISVTEINEEYYAFELCDQTTDVCSNIAEGYLFNTVEVLEIVKALRTEGKLRIAGNIGIGVGLYATTGFVGGAIGVAAAGGIILGPAAGLFFGAGIGSLVGIGADVVFALKNPLAPGKYFKLADAVEQSTMTSGKVFISRGDVAELAALLEKKLLK